MSTEELLNKIAHLESLNDHLQTEINYVDELMRMLGFHHGILTVKATANEIIRQGLHENNGNT